ncbi:hypothetical protein BKA62DRAFT_706403, partial [Auriculariales sp. MPI-PUGE-AT-0066]
MADQGAPSSAQLLTLKERNGLSNQLRSAVQNALERANSESSELVLRIVSELKTTLHNALNAIVSEYAPGASVELGFSGPAQPLSVSSALFPPNSLHLGNNHSTSQAAGRNSEPSSNASTAAVLSSSPPQNRPGNSLAVFSTGPITSPTTHTQAAYSLTHTDAPNEPPIGINTQFPPLSEETLAAVRRLSGHMNVGSSQPALRMHSSVVPPTGSDTNRWRTPEKCQPGMLASSIKRESPSNHLTVNPISITRRNRLYDAGPRQQVSILSLSDEVLVRVFRYIMPHYTSPGMVSHFASPSLPPAEFWPKHLPLEALVSATHVCRRWRALALSTQGAHLWTNLIGLTSSALDALPALLARSSPPRNATPVQLKNLSLVLELDFVRSSNFDYRRAVNAVAQDMFRVRVLIVRVNAQRTAAWNSLNPLWRAPADLLEELEVSDPPYGLENPKSLHHNIFAGLAPKLHTARMHTHLIPAHPDGSPCSALANLLIFTALDLAPDFPKERDMRRLIDTASKLSTITLLSPVKDAPLNGGPKADKELWKRLERHYGGARRVREICIVDVGERERDGHITSREFDMHDRRDRDSKAEKPHSGPIRLVVPSLQLFQHIEMPTVHIVAPENDTFKFILRRLNNIQHLALVPDESQMLSSLNLDALVPVASARAPGWGGSSVDFARAHGYGMDLSNASGHLAQVALLDDKNCARIFTRAPSTVVNTVLRQGRIRDDIFATLVSVALPTVLPGDLWADVIRTEMRRVEDVTLLLFESTMNYGVTHQLGSHSIAVSMAGAADTRLVHLFSATSSQRWSLPALRRIKFSTREPFI